MKEDLSASVGFSEATTIIRSIVFFFIPLAVVIGSIVFTIYYNNIKAERKLIETRERDVINLGLATLTLDIKSVVSDLTILADHFEHKWAFDAGETSHNVLSLEYLVISKHKQSYDQVRYLDEKGMEVVRINFNEGSPSIVPEDKLQNKGKRYYFTDAFKIKRGEIYISF